MNKIKTSDDNGLVKAVVISVVGAVASYFAVSFTKKLLEEKPLQTRIREGKAKAVDIKDAAIGKVSSLIKDASEELDKKD